METLLWLGGLFVAKKAFEVVYGKLYEQYWNQYEQSRVVLGFAG